MTRLAPPDLLALATEANLAPSVHNTQPTRWHLEPGGDVTLIADVSRRLQVGDPAGRDLRVSLGAALEATAIALSARGLAWQTAPLTERAEASGSLHVGATTDPLHAAIPRRFTWRRLFAPATRQQAQSLDGWAATRDDITLIGHHGLAAISEFNEHASLGFFRNASYRAELLSWMRLSTNDPYFGRDGLSAPALGMSRLEALGAGIVLRDPWFGLLDRVGLAPSLISEHARTLTATAVLLFHRPQGENPIDTGRALYRRLLEITALGLSTWPMAVLADDPDTAVQLKRRHGIPDGHRLINAWRTGIVPSGAATPRRERLPAEALITA
jgi:nitroreductase